MAAPRESDSTPSPTRYHRTTMYESYFHLTHRPFAAPPAAERYIPTDALEQARTTLVRVVQRAEGPGLVIGSAGTGKSLLCQLVAEHFRGKFAVATLAAARLSTRRALLQNILFELKLPYRDMDESELRLSLIDHLEPRESGLAGLLLLVDEAHTLPLRLLEEVRLITNLVRDGEPLVRLILAGGMQLEERLASPKLESFQQRIAARCYLQPMGRDETIYYVQEQLKRAGAPADGLFTAAALRAIHTASDGVPRLVNQLCDHALMLAALGGHTQLDAAGINEAWADLQQLPVPWHEAKRPAASAAPAASVIEFGQLDDEAPLAADSAANASAADAPDVRGTSAFEFGSPASSSAPTLVGPYQPTQAHAAEAGLDAIQARLAALDEELPREGDPDDFSPADDNQTEVELIFHSAHDPFGHGWEEEEVVIDRFAPLPASRLRRVTSDESRELAAAIGLRESLSERESASPTISLSIGSLESNLLKTDSPARSAQDRKRCGRTANRKRRESDLVRSGQRPAVARGGRRARVARADDAVAPRSGDGRSRHDCGDRRPARRPAAGDALAAAAGLPTALQFLAQSLTAASPLADQIPRAATMSRLLQALKNLENRQPEAKAAAPPAAEQRGAGHSGAEPQPGELELVAASGGGKGLLAHLADRLHTPSPDPAPTPRTPARPTPIATPEASGPLAKLSAGVPAAWLAAPTNEQLAGLPRSC
jgi:type II secretory pathway predicted ATPase ExeA